MKPQSEQDLWKRVAKGECLDALGIECRNGRFALERVAVPQPRIGNSQRTPLGVIDELEQLTVIDESKWKSFHFINSNLDNLRFYNSAINDCVFETCRCRDWRLWATTISDTAFQRADLRDSSLGGLLRGEKNSFRNVIFEGTDFRGCECTSADFVGCTFKDAKLDKVDFRFSSFTDCRFEGVLEEVLFYGSSFRNRDSHGTEMKNVDFRQATLRWVEFRGLDLESVQLPENDDHLIVRDYCRTLDRLIEATSKKNSEPFKVLLSVLQVHRKWAGKNQKRGILNKDDLIEVAGEEGAEYVAQFISSYRLQ